MKQTCSSFAKINLFLYVTARREDGYHDLCSLMVQIDLCDTLYFDFSQDVLSVSCNHTMVPEDDTNLVMKAARLFYRALENKQQVRDQGLGIYIDKHIPPGGGLGGGSSNAAAVLKALNHYHGEPFSLDQLMALGLQLGADVPFFIFGKPALATGVGEKLRQVRQLPHHHLILCDPGVASSTAAVFKGIDSILTFKQKDNIKTGLNKFIRGGVSDTDAGFHNDLEAPACRLYPEIRDAKNEMAMLLNKRVHMTGSGSSLFALYTDPDAAQEGFEKIRTKWAGSLRKVFLSSFK